jgi:PPOX class probable F420-dependent enzyme
VADVLPGAHTAFGARIRERLRSEAVIWLVTTAADGTPQPNPVWFLWHEPDVLLVYSMGGAARLRNCVERPNVALHFNTNSGGGDVVVFTGAVAVASRPAANQNPDYLAKYEQAMQQVSGSTEAFAATYSVPLEITLERVRGF